jgi:hypothetical protein
MAVGRQIVHQSNCSAGGSSPIVQQKRREPPPLTWQEMPPTHPWLDFLEYAKYRISSHQYGLTLKIGKRTKMQQWVTYSTFI